MRKKNRMRRGLALALSTAMVLGMMPSMGDNLKEVQAAETSTIKKIELKTNGIIDKDKYNDKDFVYFGNYKGTDIKWKVLDADADNTRKAGGMFLLSEYLLEQNNKPFDENGAANEGQTNPNEWQGSDAQAWCKTFAESDAFTKSEKKALKGVGKSDNAIKLYNRNWGTSELKEIEDKVFYLSAEEAANYIGAQQEAPGLATTTRVGAAGGWWLRSPYNNITPDAGYVDEDGYVTIGNVDYPYPGVRPAFNLNLESVLFSSVSGTSKDSFAFVENSTNSTNTWKVTLKDTEASSFAATLPDTGKVGQTVSVNVTTAGSGSVAYNQTSAMLVDSSDNVVAYGKIGDTTANKKEFTIPTDVPAGAYTLKVFPEQVNEATETDYAGNVVEQDITISVQEIPSVDITEITAPVAGNALSTEATCETSGVATTAPTVTWTQGVDTVTGNAENNRVYRAKVTVTHSTGYVFTASTTAKINGNTAEKKVNDDGTMTISYSFPKTEKKAPEKTYYVTKDELMNGFGLTDGDTKGKIVFGSDPTKDDVARTWYIAGADGTDRLSLLSTSEFQTGEYGRNSKYSESNFVKADGYFATYLNPENKYFTSEETKKMCETTVSTLEYDQKDSDDKRTVTNQLYIPDAADRHSYGNDFTYIYIGSNNDIKVSLSEINDMTSSRDYFWLRSPRNDNMLIVLAAFLGGNVGISDVIDTQALVVPAFDLNLSSVLFASTALAASSDGYKANDDEDGMKANTFTLRYEPDSDSALANATATINPAGSSVTITGAAGDMYLVAQNSTGVYTQKLTSGTTSVKASDIDAIDNFKNYDVWLESTDDYRITTAKIAEQETASVTITNPDDSHITLSSAEGNGTEEQKDLTGAMTAVVYTADEGYYFPDTYVNSIEGLTGGKLNGVTVTRDDAGKITVSGTPTAASTEITLKPATEKKIALTVTAPTFGSFTEGDSRPAAQNITIANDTDANFDATVEGVTLTGDNANSFTVDGSGYDWKVQPIDGLTANTNGTAKTYTATINVAYNATTGLTSPATADVSFTVNPKSNTVTVTNGILAEGTSSGTYNKGATVTATADTAEEGWEFDKWTGIDGLTLVEETTATSETIKFTMPENAVSIKATYKDVKAPTIEIKEGTNIINKILNTLTFGKFFKETKTFSIDYIDKESGIDTQQYCVSAKLLSETELDSATWENYTDKFSIDAKSKNVIYAKAVDKDGNVTIVNSDGIVVYTDSAQVTRSLTFVKNVTGDLDATVTLNDNTIKEIKNGTELVNTANYTIDGNKITFKAAYLNTLTTGTKTFTISYNPMGEEYVENKNAEGVDQNQAPATTSIQVEIEPQPIVEKVTASPKPGTYTENQTVTLTSATEGATIYYTIDESDPSVENGAEYTGALLINGSEGQTVRKTIKAIAVKDGMQTSDVSTLEYTIKIPGIVYEITKGAGSTYQLNTTGTITITCTGELSKLTGIYVDDKLVDPKNYEAKEGSTILTFKTDYLNTLEVGTHKLRFEYTDGSAETTFTITKAEQASNQTNDTPKKTTGTKASGVQTGDETGIGWMLALLVVSGGLIVLLVGKRRRRR